ncbi:MAG TPA: transporter [Gammaproteobacteria bacterium]|nr:transporter [Gammaproteobacteria bacterium]
MKSDKALNSGCPADKSNTYCPAMSGHRAKALARQAGGAIAGGAVLLVVSTSVFAHGESLRGGGSGSINTVGASILEEKVIGLRWDARRYETFSDQQLIDFKADGEDVHMHSSEDAYFLTYGFPVNEDMDISLMWQYNNFKGFKDNGDDFANDCFAKNPPVKGDPSSAKCISPTKESPGFGDMLITGRYRFFNDGDNQWASVFGVILPTGKITNRTDNGEIIGTHNQPGSGAITFQGGIAFSGHLTESIALDADVIYRFGTQGAKQFRPGNSLQADVAAAFAHHSSIVPVIELNAIFFDQDIENDEIKKNSGGDVVYLSPGINYKISKRQGIYANFSYPVYQELGGISNDEKYRWSLGWSSAF